MSVAPSQQEICDLFVHCGIGDLDGMHFSCDQVCEGLGFISTLFRVSIGQRSFIVKVTDPHKEFDHQIDNAFSFLCGAHNRELAVYSWMKSLAQCGIATPTGVPQYFGGRHCGKANGIVIMEDLSGRIARQIVYVEGFKVHQMLQLVEQIVNYQAAFLSTDQELILSDVESLIQAESDFFIQQIDELPDMKWWSEDKTKNGRTRKEVMKEWSAVEQLKETQQKYPSTVKDLPVVLCHCDLWPNNLLWEKTDEDSDVSLLAIVDWQCSKHGVCLLDLTTPIAVCFDVDTRRGHLDTSLNFYVQEMNARSASFKKSFEITYDKASAVFNHSLRFGALQLMMTIVQSPQEDRNGILTARLQALLEDIIPI